MSYISLNRSLKINTNGGGLTIKPPPMWHTDALITTCPGIDITLAGGFD